MSSSLLSTLPNYALSTLLLFSALSRFTHGTFPGTSAYYTFQLNHGNEPQTSPLIPVLDASLGLLLIVPLSRNARTRRRQRLIVSVLGLLLMGTGLVMQVQASKEYGGDVVTSLIAGVAVVGNLVG